MKKSKLLPPAYFYLFVLLMLGLHFLFPVHKIVPFPWNVFGVLFLVAGLVLSIMGDAVFRKVGTTIKPYQESTSLVTGGLFSFSRNPMYLGYVLLLTGAAVLMGSLTPFLVIPLFALIIHILFITVEEEMLAAKFGQEYLDYKEHVRRWL